jgi:hypothetical protein
MAQMGHTSSILTLDLYARAWNRRDGEAERLRALVNGEAWVPPKAPDRHPERVGRQSQIA